MDYTRPVEALIPGVRGRLLAACLRSDEPQSMRQLSHLAHVSRARVTAVVIDLEALGLVHRDSVGTSLLVSLVDESPVVQALRQVADLRSITLHRWTERARELTPAPVSLAIYGSWARGQARVNSDIDVLLVLPADLAVEHEDAYRSQFGAWCQFASRVAGLTVSPLVLDEIETKAVDGPLWDDLVQDAVTLVGRPAREVLGGS